MLDPVSFEPLLAATILTQCGHTFNSNTLSALPTSTCPLCGVAFDRETGTQPNFALRAVVEAFQKKTASPVASPSQEPAELAASTPATPIGRAKPLASMKPPLAYSPKPRIQTVRCERCATDFQQRSGKVPPERGCAHVGAWHAAFGDCSVRCAFGLGVLGIGKQHWSCCFSTSSANVGCAQSAHTGRTLVRSASHKPEE